MSYEFYDDEADWQSPVEVSTETMKKIKNRKIGLGKAALFALK